VNGNLQTLRMNRRTFLGSFSTLLALPALAREAPAGMVKIAGGSYTPMFGKASTLRGVAAFALDITQVTNAEFLAFVTEHPEWRRSQVKRVFADASYLKHWAGDLDLGAQTDQLKDAPVTAVSWFAARAYLKTKGRRLPTTDEWEFAARASATEADASRSDEFNRRILEWYAKPTLAVLPAVQTSEANLFGVRGMHGVVWEWVADFNNAISTGEGRGGDTVDRDLFCGAGAVATANPANYAAFMRYAFRSSLQGNYCVPNLGFRGALTL
jgi:sulfatase modifying factor 1